MRSSIQYALGLALATTMAVSHATTLTIESWRVDDSDLWEDVLIPVFEAEHPDIQVRFSPTSPTEYDSTVNARLQAGTAGDLITCRPFDVSLNLYQEGHLLDLTDMAAMDNFEDFARSAWTTDDGASTFCMPMASVIHGFLYNPEIFAELDLEVPRTEDEFLAVLDTIEQESSYTPLALGTNDQWESNQIVYTNIGPAFWGGEAGRQALLDGSASFTDPEFVAPFEHMARWGEYMGRGYESQTYGDSQNLFSLGRAAIYPTGSWDISYFNQQALFEFDAFPPFRVGDDGQCVISDHTDIGMGINPDSENAEAAKLFLEWLASEGFARLYTNEVTGFFSLSKHEVEVRDPVAAEMINWRQDCDSTIRLNAQIMNRGTPNMEQELWTVGSRVLNGAMTPQEAAERIQNGFSSWYAPQQ
ncbi:carbohydrate ABC transporter substrate-binding protein [Natronospirillum operosum]|uniref:Probable sugar-binding periplasmic protein n=1 Tax=Natronospirillum operosum TaxID=2759953 RepID=A0A4Z0WDC1_9GAMM|nr:ABC transporter substrate-binding protein [Natronospirillum operosum]TGG95864.1 carbohydrate ABC transporter substrate-binding protein [Natronospirillum operosum]